MQFLRALAAALVALSFASAAHAAECPNCVLDFPSSWNAEEQPWGTRVWLEGQQIDVKVQPDESVEPLGPGDVDDELVWLSAEIESEGHTIGSKNGRIVRTASREPAVVLDYAWTDQDGTQGKGIRLVRRCGVRLIIEQRAEEIRLDALLGVSDRVRYSRSECVSLNADIIPLEVLEGVDNVELPDVADVVPTPSTSTDPSDAAPTEPVDQGDAPSDPVPAEPPPAPAEESSPLTTLLLAVGLLLLVVLIVLMLRSSREDPLEGLPPLDTPQQPGGQGPPPEPEPEPRSAPGPHSGTYAVGGGQARMGQGFPADDATDESPAALDDHEQITADEFGDENTDAILPAGTYGLRGAGGGERSEPATAGEPEESDAGASLEVSDPEMMLHAVPPGEDPRSEPPISVPDAGTISVPSHAVVSFPSVSSVSTRGVEVGEAPSYDQDDYIQVSPVESVIASLGITTWLDFTAPGISGVSYLPSSIADLLEVQNGGRFGYGWLLLLGLRRKNMDLMTINGEARVKARFGEGWLVGVFAFGNVLWVNPDQTWEIRTLDGERFPLGDCAESAIRALAENPELRDRGAPRELVERCRTAVGELLPGWVYRFLGEPGGPSDPADQPVDIVPFLESLG